MTGIYVRHKQGEAPSLRPFPPKAASHPTVGELCLACGNPLEGGQSTTLIPLGPGDDIESRQKAADGRWYNAVAVEIHYVCATGREESDAE